MAKTERDQRLREIAMDPARKEKKKIIENSLTATSIEELLDLGLTEKEIWDLCAQVSSAINKYNASHPSEMLRKEPNVIKEQLELGLSALIFSKNDKEVKFLYHGTAYRMFENGEENILGTQIIEFGSAITNEEFRGGYGLGTLGAKARLGLLQKFRKPNVSTFGLSTIKRMVTGRVWSKLGAEAVSFWKTPYVSYLTDTCEVSSERYGHSSCGVRRSREESTPQALSASIKNPEYNGHLPCTLIVTSQKKALEFDSKMKKYHQELFGVSIEPGNISVESYKEIGRFFEEITRMSSIDKK